MYFYQGDGPKLLPEHKKMLRGLKINLDGPGTILHDFEAVLDILNEQPMMLTPSGQLTLNMVSKINVRLVHPIQLGLKRPQQKSYPHIHGLYLLLRASGLAYPDESGKKPLLMLEKTVCQQWEALNPTERYFTLLETWLLRGKPEIIGEYRRPFDIIPDNFSSAAFYYLKLPSEGLPIVGHRDAETELLYRPGWHNLGLLDLFGLIDVEHGLPEPDKGWRIKTIYRTVLGDSLLTMLYTGFFKDVAKVFELEDTGTVPAGTLQPVLQPYFPEWKNNLILPRWTFREGTYIFKVSLGSVWCRITIGAKDVLDDLAALIIKSVGFDDDHLYEFTYRNRFGIIESVLHPYMEDGLLFTSEVMIGDLPIQPGQTMTFLFDFGDNWEFKVALEQVDPNKAINKPRIVEKHGKSPRQYQSWDE